MGFRVYIVPVEHFKEIDGKLRSPQTDWLWNECDLDDSKDGKSFFYDTQELYWSYNWSMEEFKKFMYIRDLAGNTMEYVVQKLVDALADLSIRGVTPMIPEGCDAWTENLQVFGYNMVCLLNFCVHHPNCVLVLDEKHLIRDSVKLKLGQSLVIQN